MSTITSKVKFYESWKNLALGNRIRIFENLDELLSSDFNGLISIRYKKAGSPYKAFYVPTNKILETIEKFVQAGADRNLFVFNESTPDDYLLIQGEAQYIDKDGLTLTYNTKKCSMKEAMINPMIASGLKSKMIMEYYMNPKSYDMIRDLFEIYPNDVIEFGVYGKNLGFFSGHNTIIWEIRGNY